MWISRCSHHCVQLFASKNCERPGVVVVEHRLTLNWPLLHEKGTVENVQLTCMKPWKRNLNTYFELKSVYFVAMHITICQVILCWNFWILAILGNIEHIRILNVLKLTLTLDLNFYCISNWLCIRYTLPEVIRIRSVFGFWNILETFLAKHHQYEIQSTLNAGSFWAS